MLTTRIVGLGSDFGDDQVGYRVIEALGVVPLPTGCSLHRCSDPAADLLPLLSGARHAILIDAVVDGGSPGRVRSCDVCDLSRAGTTSIHGVSVASMLTLAKALGMLPPVLTILGVTIDPQHDPHALDLSPPVRAVLPVLVETVRAAAADEVAV